MEMRFFAAFAAFAFVMSFYSAAEACTRVVSATAAKTIVPTDRINQKLLDDAVRAEVNYHRCRAGLPVVRSAGKEMVRKARGHSRWMAKSQKLSHQSTVPGAQTLKQRVRAAGVAGKYGAENIGMVHRYQIDERRIKIVSSRGCKFATSRGEVLPPHSYASLARFAVHRWMKSPEHRKNILGPRFSKVSTAVAFDPKAKYCGLFWLTQNFIG